MFINHISVSTLPVLHQFGGAIERRIVETASEQARRGHEVHVYSVGDNTETRCVNGVSYHFLRCKARLPLKHLEFQYRVARRLKNAPKESILHFHSQPEGALMSQFVSAKKLLQYDFYHFRGGPRSPLHAVYKYALRRFDLLLPCSSYCLRESQEFWSLPTEKLRILHNGVNVTQFYPNSEAAGRERRLLGIQERIVMYVGRVCEQKGSDVLLDAMKRINKRRKDCKLVIAGPIGQFGLTDDPNHWQERIKEVGGVYLGAVKEDRLADIYNLADIFVMPTRSFEMFGMAAVEAQACGKPVIASDLGGLKEVVPDKCGARFPVGDAECLCDQIELLLDDSDRYKDASANARINARKYDWRNICDDLERIYKE